MEELRAIPGIGEVKAVKILCLSEIARRIVREKVRREQRFDSAELIAEYYMESMRHLETEETVLLHFDSKMSLLGEDIMTKGTVNGALISPREIFIQALRRGAVRIVLLHNHPSGDPVPSSEDISSTRQIKRAGELLGISLTDHIIIGDLCYCSLKEMGLLSDETTEF
jgi:DNA repair protein RadC